MICSGLAAFFCWLLSLAHPIPTFASRMTTQTIQYEYAPGHFRASEPGVYQPDRLGEGEMVLNMGPQHPSTHGVLRLEVVTDGEIVVDVVPHVGYLHR